jgi:hypothetical protein
MNPPTAGTAARTFAIALLAPSRAAPAAVDMALATALRGSFVGCIVSVVAVSISLSPNRKVSNQSQNA